MQRRRQRRRVFESLEQRYCFSGASVVSRLIASRAGVSTLPEEPAPSALVSEPLVEQSAALPVASIIPNNRQSFTATAAAPDSQWDWLADTEWYVPADNLLAYAAESDLSNPVPIGDQTLWYIEESANGQISGQATVQLSISSSTSQLTFTGVVTRNGQIRIEFTNSSSGVTTTGIGQMRLRDGDWYMQMQMVTGSSLVITHWANMALSNGSTSPPDASEPPQENLASANYRWLEGTTWTITDKNLFGKSKSGVFSIDSYESGYFWGTGTSKKPFNVLGSVTPEGNLLFVVSVNGGTPNSRTGTLQKTPYGGMMTLRTYEGKPAIGYAWSVDVSIGINAAIAQLTNSMLDIARQSSDYQLSKSQVRDLVKDFTREIIDLARTNT